jgi:acetolactate decarboxylase
MTLDAPLVAAATLRTSGGAGPAECDTVDATRQLQLAHVLLDGGYDGVTTLEEALAGGDIGLGTLDRLDGELVVVDGEPWQVDYTGRANLVPLTRRTPFVVVSTMESPVTTRLHDVDRTAVAAAIDDLAGDPGAIVTVRLEGSFNRVLLRSVPPQDPPYRPYLEVCATDEVRWEHHRFYGVFVGFRFPDLTPGATIPGLHLHGLDRLRTTGGHNHELHVDDALLSVSVSRKVVVQLPERSMTDLLETPAPMRAIQRTLLRTGGATIAQVAAALDLSEALARQRLTWLAERGYVAEEPPSDPVSDPRWRTSLRVPAARSSGRVADLLDSL